MEIRIPQSGDIYKHFKGNLYEVVLIARDSETLEEKVVYKELNGEKAYVRSLPMFVSPVDKEKYPDVQQEYRFELVKNDVVEESEEESTLENPSLILGFLELSTVEEKLKYLQSVKNDISETFLEMAAQSLEFVEKKGTLTQRYEDLILYLSTVERYEKSRLR